LVLIHNYNAEQRLDAVIECLGARTVGGTPNPCSHPFSSTYTRCSTNDTGRKNILGERRIRILSMTPTRITFSSADSVLPTRLRGDYRGPLIRPKHGWPRILSNPHTYVRSSATTPARNHINPQPRRLIPIQLKSLITLLLLSHLSYQIPQHTLPPCPTPRLQNQISVSSCRQMNLRRAKHVTNLPSLHDLHAPTDTHNRYRILPLPSLYLHHHRIPTALLPLRRNNGMQLQHLHAQRVPLHLRARRRGQVYKGRFIRVSRTLPISLSYLRVLISQPCLAAGRR
jgi:hypothetical protein